MGEELRIISYISPNVESKLLEYQLSDNLIDMFQRCMPLYNNLKHVSLLVIPSELQTIFCSNPYLKIFKSLIENDSQSNIIFGQSQLPKKCVNTNSTDLFHDYPNAFYTANSILKSLSEWNYPILIDLEKCVVRKKFCEACDNSLPCSVGIDLTSCKIPTIDEFQVNLSRFVKKNIEHWHFKRETISTYDLKKLAFLLSIFYGVESENFLNENDYYIHKDLCNDIKSDSKNSFENISFSIFRASKFHSCTDSTKSRNKFSIDWHRNDPNKVLGYQLYRADVVNPLKSGTSNSGTERLLFTFKENKKYFLAYTSNHDFHLDTIKSRINTIEDSCS